MNILALDTSMGACSAALLRCDGEVFARAETMTRGHAEALMPMVAQVMDESGVAFAALDRIAATTGPGSFTGVRIAISAARGLALVTGAKLFGIDSLTVMAKEALKCRTGLAEASFIAGRDDAIVPFHSLLKCGST
jgi:tRNA threonylcarbamoyl adenosine modification protein YeaZ